MANPKVAVSKPTPPPVAPVVEPTGRKKATYTKDAEAGTCKVTLPSGESVVFGLDRIPAALHRRLAFHGLIQKVMDSAAGDKGAAAVASMKATIEQLGRGIWTERVTVDPEVRRRNIADAIAKVFGPAYHKKYSKPLTAAIALAYEKKVFTKLSKDPRVLAELGKSAPVAESLL